MRETIEGSCGVSYRHAAEAMPDVIPGIYYGARAILSLPPEHKRGRDGLIAIFWDWWAKQEIGEHLEFQQNRETYMYKNRKAVIDAVNRIEKAKSYEEAVDMLRAVVSVIERRYDVEAEEE